MRGPRGGYRLARERQRITIGDIVRVVQGGGNRALETDGMEGSELGTKVVRPLWAKIHDRVMAQLDNLSIEDLRSEADKAGIVIESHNALDFTI